MGGLVIRRLRPATFTASEAEQIAGVSGAMLRDWRRRDLIDASPGRGWKRLATDELIQILVMRILIKRNVRLRFAREVGQKASGPIFHKLLREAYPTEKMDFKGLTSAPRYLNVLTECPSEFGMVAALAPRTGETPSHFDSLEERYLIYVELDDPAGELEYHMYLSKSAEVLPLGAFLDSIRNPKFKQQKVFAILALDLFDVYQELIDKRIKPYFVEVDE
jgi:hypothetical protein